MRAYHQEESERVVELRSATAFAGFEGRDDSEAAGGEDDAKRDPETPVRGESSGAEGVSDRHFPGGEGDQHLGSPPRPPLQLSSKTKDLPHAGKQLHQPTIPKRNRHHNVRLRDVPRAHVDQTQHKCRERKGAQSQWCRVGNLPVLYLAVQTGLELSSESWKTSGSTGGSVSERTVAEAGGGFGGLVFLVGHFALNTVVAGLVVLFVEAVDALPGVFGVRHGRHCECIVCGSAAGGIDGWMEYAQLVENASSFGERKKGRSEVVKGNGFPRAWGICGEMKGQSW